MYKIIVVVYVLAVTAASCKSLQQEVQEKNNETVVKLEEPQKTPEVASRQSRKRVASLNDVLRCGIDIPCVLQNLEAVLDDRKHIILAEADGRYMTSSVARAESTESPSELAQTVEGIINKMTDIVKDTVSSWLKDVKLDEESVEEVTEIDNTAEEEQTEQDEDKDIEEGRGKKKKKLKSLMKLLILGAVLKAKLTVLLQLLSAALQIKFFFIALAGLLINKIRLWYDLKKGHHPQKVIYYEHAQHQHHYDHEEDHGHGGGGFWGRAYEVPEEQEDNSSPQEMAYRGQRPIPWTQQPY